MVNNKSLKTLYIISFLLSIQYAFTAYINSTYLDRFMGDRAVGLVFTVAATLAVLGLLKMPELLNKIGNYRTFLWLTILSIAGLFGLIVSKNTYLIILLFLIYLIFNYLSIFSRDIFIEDYSDIKSMGKIRGLFLTIINLGWIFAPILAAITVRSFGYQGIYMLAAIAYLPILFIFFRRFHKFKDPVYKKISVRETIKKIWADKDIFRIYTSNLLLQFFYAWMVIYTPIYLNAHLGFSWSQIGIIFMIMLLPFVLIQFVLGRLSDRIGQKKMLYIGFTIMILSTAALSFIGPSSIWVWGIALFITRVGAAIVEVMTETYFFKKVHVNDTDTISFFRNTAPISYIFAPVLASIFFLFAPFNYIFLALSFILLFGLRLTSKIKDTI